LPDGDRAIVDVTKLRDYCLNPGHPVGKHKARVFASALGLTATDVALLHSALRMAAATGDAVAGRHLEHGQLYTVDFLMHVGAREAMVRSGWIIRRGEGVPRLTTCYVL